MEINKTREERRGEERRAVSAVPTDLAFVVGRVTVSERVTGIEPALSAWEAWQFSR
jgi:hypothetical protein